MKEIQGRVDLDGVTAFEPTQQEAAAKGVERVEPNASGAHFSPHAGAGSWVESSWELGRGLVVSEGLPLDAGLEEWLRAMMPR